MANNWVVQTVTVTVLLAAGVGSAGAMEQMNVSWGQLCTVAQRHELSVATRNGKTEKGMCESTDASVLTLSRGGKLTKIDRAEISRVRLRRPVSHHGFRDRTEDVGLAILLGGASLVPEALQPLGLISVPIFVAYELVAIPVNALHDLLHEIFNPQKSVEITLV
jgi:hypothetical protein